MKIIDIATRRRVTIAMFTLAVILFGIVSFSRLKINLLPNLTYPTLTVRTNYQGAAPAEIENLISKPIEETLGVVKNLKRISSISRSGQSDVLLEFNWGTNMDYAGLDVREKLDALELPLEIQRPTILRFDPSLDPIMRFGFYRHISSDSQKTEIFDEEELKLLRRFTEQEIKKDLESALGVAAVKVSGGLEDEIQVLVDQERAAQLNLSLQGLVQQLQAENVNLSGGRLKEETYQYLIRTLNQFKTVTEIGNVIVSSNEGKQVYLRDIAEVKKGFKERQAITRLNGKEAVEIAIYKEGDANTVAVSRAVMQRLNRIRSKLLSNTELIKVYDQSTFITQAVNEVIQAGIIGGILAVIILYFFLRNFYTTVIISLSIPVSVIATFNLMYGTDLTLNIMSLGGIALGIGMLLDNSIVVLENIARHREKGKNVLQAARDGASEVSTAVIASTLTTVAVFFPLVFVKGIAGQLFRDQALTVTFALLASLVVALTLIPMLASLQSAKKSLIEQKSKRHPQTKIGRVMNSIQHFIFVTTPSMIIKIIISFARIIARSMGFLISPLVKGFHRIYQGLEKNYPPFLQKVLLKPGIVITTALLLFLFSLYLVSTLGVELIPQLSQGEFIVEFKLPPGTPLTQTDEAIHQIQKYAEDVQGIATTFSVAGTGNRMDANPEQGGENWGDLNIMMESGFHKKDEERITEQIRIKLQTLPAVQYKFSRPTLFSFKTPVEIQVAGYNLDYLKTISGDIAEKLQTSERFADVKSSMQTGHPEIQIRFDRERAAALGLVVYQIADRVVSKVRGDVASRYSWRDRKIDILVRTREQDRNSVDKIGQLIVNPESKHPVPLKAVAEIIENIGPGEIRRSDQERIALVTANLNFGDLGTAIREINMVLSKINIPRDMNIRLTGQSQEMSVSFKSLQFALLLAVFLVYLVMASQFESFLHPFVILFTIPLALIGAVLALWITGCTLSVVVFIGMILLAGIVVNNAIVLIDLINKLRNRGLKKMEAIVEGSRSRLRPILMTTLTTALGLLPLALGFGKGAEVRSPMAITVIGGLTVSTLLTLVVIPVVYHLVDRKE